MEKKRFSFIGSLPASKSLMNRALVAKSYFPHLHINGKSECDDVVLMEQGLRSLAAGQPVKCGHAGTVLRFLALRASRYSGKHTLQGSERLFQRPQSELLPILQQLGTSARFQPNSLIIESEGWRLIGDGLHLSASRSSQFASAVLLNAWLLPFDLHVRMESKVVSEGYWRMTLALLRRLGMEIVENGKEYIVPKNQSLHVTEIDVEPDMSSAFAVCALAAISGNAVIRNFPEESLQPDARFTAIFDKMGISVRQQGHDLLVNQTPAFKGLNVDISDSPDLFPVLAVLAAKAKGASFIQGTGVLEYKESPRLTKTSELLERMGARIEVHGDCARIQPDATGNSEEFQFDVADDHRLVMAAAVARAAGVPVRVTDANVVTKSFPEFLNIAGGYL